jgi:uncharacterized protein YigE (DUF2233 family)
MSLSSNKILLANASTNTAGAYFEIVTVSSVGIGNLTAMNAGTSSAQFVPAGWYIIPAGTTNVTIELNTYASNVNNWVTYLASNTAGTIMSDGWNVRANAVTGTQTLTLYGVNDGQAATGQYNNK